MTAAYNTWRRQGNPSTTGRFYGIAVLFERLRSAANDTLSPRELLDKAAGYFVRSYGANHEAEAALRLVADLEPENLRRLSWGIP